MFFFFSYIYNTFLLYVVLSFRKYVTWNNASWLCMDYSIYTLMYCISLGLVCILSMHSRWGRCLAFQPCSAIYALSLHLITLGSLAWLTQQTKPHVLNITVCVPALLIPLLQNILSVFKRLVWSAP